MTYLRSVLFVVASLVVGAQAFAGDDVSLIERYRCHHVLLGTLGTLSLETRRVDSQRVQIELAGDALGMMALVDGHRQQRYCSVIQQDSQGHVMALSHRQSTSIDSRGRRIQYGWLTTFDQGGIAHGQRLWGGEVVEHRSTQIPSDCCGDFLSVLYAFQHQDEPLQVSKVYRYPFWALQGGGRIEVTVEEVDTHDRGTSSEALWRCRITSESGRLPGNCTSLTVWCDDQRRVVKAEVPFLWGFGTVVVQRISESS